MSEGAIPTQKRRILSIDGGGILGTFPAAFLAGIEEQLEKPIGEYFDLISGTSTGGIIALGLGMGLRAADILQMYEANSTALSRSRGRRIISRIPPAIACLW